MQKTKLVKTRVRTVTCPGCKTEIYSRARHDYRHCPCGATMVDGGFEYLRYGHNADLPSVITRIRYVKATRYQLFQDWNKGEDNFGVINHG